ncbi:MAG TPA: hypothetical protein DCY06_09635 [Bacteroidetes bacterium]|nr:hypothetical protein [Bacteroidota bacterium]
MGFIIIVLLFIAYQISKVNSYKNTLTSQPEVTKEMISLKDSDVKIKSEGSNTHSSNDNSNPMLPQWKTFTNNDGRYKFQYPPDWNAFVNKYNEKDSLFGVNATSESGTGGVEVISYNGSINSYLGNLEKNSEIHFTVFENIEINGIPAIKTKYNGSPVSGLSVYLKKDNQIFNVYINSSDVNSISLFEKLASGFSIL